VHNQPPTFQQDVGNNTRQERKKKQEECSFTAVNTKPQQIDYQVT
jgi:hypothetical protein